MQTVTHNKTLATAIPQELQDRKQWLRWGYRDREQTQKIPLHPDGRWAKTNAPDSFHSFTEVNQCDRVAYVIQGDDPYTGIDLDGCLDADGHLVEWARPIVERLCRVGYAEVSPSGKGIKILTRGKKPGGSRCVNKMGEGKQQLEVYDFNRFWTVTGDVYMMADEISDGQAEIDWLCQEYLQDAVRTEDNITFTIDPRGNLWGFNADDYEPYCAEDHETLQYEIYPSSKLQRRAESYLSAADRPGTGNRNNAAFGLAGHLRAIDEHGERLTEEQIINYMMGWNASLPEPLGERELLQAVRSSRVNGTRRAPKEAQETSGDLDPKVISCASSLDTLARQNASNAALKNAPTLNAPGIIADIIEYNLSTAIYPQPELAFAGAIALMSAITGRTIEDARKTRTNLMILGTGKTTSGKEHARQINKLLLEKAGFPTICGTERFTSAAGVITGLYESPVSLFQIDEFGKFLKTSCNPNNRSPLADVIPTLMQAESSANCMWRPNGYADTAHNKHVNQPHCVLYATTVPENLWNSLTPENIIDGFLNRFMVFESPDFVLPQDVARTDPPRSLVQDVKRWLDRMVAPGANLTFHGEPKPTLITYATDANDRFVTHEYQIAEKKIGESHERAAMWGRTAAKTRKLAMLFAASRARKAPFVVELEDMDRAIAISNWCTRSVLQKAFANVAENDQERHVKRVLNILQEPLTKAQLTRKTQGIRKDERRKIIEDLIESEQIYRWHRIPDGAGRFAEMFIAVSAIAQYRDQIEADERRHNAHVHELCARDNS